MDSSKEPIKLDAEQRTVIFYRTEPIALDPNPGQTAMTASQWADFRKKHCVTGPVKPVHLTTVEPRGERWNWLTLGFAIGVFFMVAADYVVRCLL